MYTLSFGAGCYGNLRHGPSRSSPGRAGSCDTAGIGSEIPSCSRCDSRNTPLDGRLGRKETRTSVNWTKEKHSLRGILFSTVCCGDDQFWLWEVFVASLPKHVHVCMYVGVGWGAYTKWDGGQVSSGSTNLFNAFALLTPISYVRRMQIIQTDRPFL